MLTLTHRLQPDPIVSVSLILSLTAEERTRSRHRFSANTGRPVYLNLPRGTVLRGGDLLQSEEEPTVLVRVAAKPEPVITVSGETPFDLLRAAYHLGNRHVSLEITPDYLRLSPDSVLESMLKQLGLKVKAEVAPFEPEAGAYGHAHPHRHASFAPSH
ncbi:MAG: urease accessory protein UreE [Pseudanabaenales cyanobacterium]|nr:urease accessory protein UreE [Pseudanabaenales cyanobacterium]